MLINKIEVDEGRDIIIMDKAFKFGEHQALYDTCMSLKYSCANTSNFNIQNITDKRMRADLPQIDQAKLISQDQEGIGLRRSLCPDCGKQATREVGGMANIPDDNTCKVIFDSSYRMALDRFARFALPCSFPPLVTSHQAAQKARRGRQDDHPDWTALPIV